MAMTQEEFDAERMRMMQGTEKREIEAHTALMAARKAEEGERAARVQLHTRRVVALELQAKNNAIIAAATAGTGRTAMLLDAAIKRIDDRTSPTGAVDIPKAVTEVLLTIAEIERQTADQADPADPPAPAPSDPPGLA